jgi:hypothetical protein
MSGFMRRLLLAGILSCLAFISALALGVTGAAPRGDTPAADQPAIEQPAAQP